MTPSWAFTRSGDRYVADLGVVERAVLADFADQVVELLGGVPGADDGAAEPPDLLDEVELDLGPVETPEDPAVHRLLPDGSRADADVAAEYRRLTEGDLRVTKTGNLRRLRSVLAAEPVEVRPQDAAAVAAALTDIRLVVAERLGIRTEEDSDALEALLLADDGTREADPDHADPDRDARVYLGTVTTMVGVLLDSLVGLMLDELP